MDLTPELLAAYVGGQMHIQNRIEGYLYRGEVEELSVLVKGDDRVLLVKFKWLAKGIGFPLPPHKWVATAGPLVIEVSSDTNFTVEDIGAGRLYLKGIMNEEFVLFPPDMESKLDPAQIEGFASLS